VTTPEDTPAAAHRATGDRVAGTSPTLAERIVRLRPRTVLVVIGVLLAVSIVLGMVWIARQFLTWVLISVFLALAINPAVEALHRGRIGRRGLAAAIVYIALLVVLAGLLAAFIPTLVAQVNKLVQAAPGFVRDVTAGRGPLGFLETKYRIVERVEQEVRGSGGSQIVSGGTAALALARSILTGIVGIVTIAFLTLFMVLEGPTWVERLYRLFPPESAQRWRNVGQGIYRTVGGYVTGNLLISVIAGATTTGVLLILGVPYALALGVVVAILDLVPLAGATLAAIIVTIVGFTVSVVAGVVVIVFFVLYQQLENHVIQPLVYGRSVQLSPLTVLISVGVGAEVAGVLGALLAIPVCGALRVILDDWYQHRRTRTESDEQAAGGAQAAPSAEVSPAQP
jgi:predicted PurR-regulated permease PerM